MLPSLKCLQYLCNIFASNNYEAFLCLRTGTDISKTVLQRIKHTAVVLKEFAALPVLHWCIRKLRIIFEEVARVLVQYCCLYQPLKNCYGGPADAEYLCLNRRCHSFKQYCFIKDIKYVIAFREVGNNIAVTTD